MKLAIMQPYLFPYIGYFQLMSAVDRWVVYDDVTFIKGGWINRNNLKVNGVRHLFSVPLSGANPYRPIHDVMVDSAHFTRWLDRFLKMLHQNYRRAPHFDSTFRLVEEVLGSGAETIAELNLRGLLAIRNQLGIATEVVPTARIYGNQQLRGQERVLDICRREGADTYINAIGGMTLYDAQTFSSQGVALYFLQPGEVAYPQFGSEFVPHMSIIDVMMHNNDAEVRTLLRRFRLIPGSQP